MESRKRSVPLVLILVSDPARARAAEIEWRRVGASVTHALDPDGCLRVATATGPDTIVLDRHAPDRLLRLLAAHPVSRGATIEWLPESLSTVMCQAA